MPLSGQKSEDRQIIGPKAKPTAITLLSRHDVKLIPYELTILVIDKNL